MPLPKLPFDKPLSWAQLSHQKVRLAVAITGVSFANILMFTMMGLESLISEGATTLHENLRGDLFLVSSFSPSLRLPVPFPRAHLIQANAVDGVAIAAPLYMNTVNWTNPAQLEQAPEGESPSDLFGNQVRVIAFNPTQPVLNLPEVDSQLNRLSGASNVLFDRLSQPSLGDVPQLLATSGEVQTLMANRQVQVVGLFSLGSTVVEKGTVVMSDWNYTQWFGPTTLQQVTLGVLTLEPGSDPATVQTQLQAHLPDSISILTLDELIGKERQFTASDPIGIIFRFGGIVGFVVGIVIVYQVLYTDISDHLPEYATLKAMGYSDSALLRVVLLEAIFLAILGFIPGYLTSLGLYQILTILTRIPLVMRSTVALQVFLLTLLMCNVSGAIAMRRLRSADPADVF
ncbi:ABC transporter permease DevC [Pseudanabaena sp. FACHB-2040]|uniref:ABC transporter permease DevC n=1 Tax=Pseudanabaena sp. FACHB-2040 TaxID=2692859 RepID=UPI0016855232|nr:ABC transporter permease DevC [Pseudanabaena sp. FACHB-2040]MBD2259465.1 FtsX-like permease family protein [Pseudanabaena sp. FACHB-2040]